VRLLFSGTTAEKDRFSSIVHALVYANSELEYEHVRVLMLRFLGNDTKHPLYAYFLRNWDDITDEWISFKRSNICHLGNNTDNRYGMHPSFAIWIITLLT
jgi:hypothetical protein